MANKVNTDFTQIVNTVDGSGSGSLFGNQATNVVKPTADAVSDAAKKAATTKSADTAPAATRALLPIGVQTPNNLDLYSADGVELPSSDFINKMRATLEKTPGLMTADEVDAAMRRQRNNLLLSSIFDGVRALANVAGAVAGAPQTMTDNGTLTSETRKRYANLWDTYDKARSARDTGLANVDLQEYNIKMQQLAYLDKKHKQEFDQSMKQLDAVYKDKLYNLRLRKQDSVEARERNRHEEAMIRAEYQHQRIELIKANKGVDGYPFEGTNYKTYSGYKNAVIAYASRNKIGPYRPHVELEDEKPMTWDELHLTVLRHIAERDANTSGATADTKNGTEEWES